MAREKNNYFKMFIKMTDYSCAAARNLKQTLSQFDAEKLPELMDYLHQIENACDDEKHIMREKLIKEFITPIERSDIVNLGHEIDEVTDEIEAVLQRVYMFNISEITPEAVEFADVVVECCDKMKIIMEEFEYYKKSDKIHDAVVEVNRLEEVGDALYMNAMRKLYTTESDAVKIVTWTELYNRLERCCDACEHVANLVESIVMKNS